MSAAVEQKAGLHRAAGFTRRFQRAAGLLADERHERWSTSRLPEHLRIESIQGSQHPSAQRREKQQVPQQHSPAKDFSWDSRQQKRAAEAAIAMGGGQNHWRSESQMTMRR
jgi:hypothetical protein